MGKIENAQWLTDVPAASARDTGNKLRAQLLESVPVRGDEERALGLAIDAVFGAWERLGVAGDASKFVEHLNSPWLLETLETQLKETRGNSGAAYELYRDWLTPFRRLPNPADPFSGQIETQRIQSSLGGYMSQLVALARGATSGTKPAAQVAPARSIQPETQGADSMKEDHKWFDKTTPRGRRERAFFAAIAVVLAIVWAHGHWSHSAADGSTSTTQSN